MSGALAEVAEPADNVVLLDARGAVIGEAPRAAVMRPERRPHAFVPPDSRRLGRRLPWWERRRRDLNPREG
jgi:hypothetical protein